MAVTGEASDCPETLDKVLKNNYDVVVLDVTMPGGSALDVVKQLRNLRPELPILVLSIHPEDQYAVRFLKAGAAGYLTKQSALEELVGAIRKVSQGRKYVSPSLAEKLASNLEIATDRPLHETLSDREYQVMLMLAQGKTIKGIAEELSLSPKTIATYRLRVLEKMRMKNNAQLIYYAIRHALVC